MTIKEDDPFSLAGVPAAQRRLSDRDLFQPVQVRTIGLKEKASKVHLLVTMAEKPSCYLELASGYQTGITFYGVTKVGDNNFVGRAKRFGRAARKATAGTTCPSGPRFDNRQQLTCIVAWGD